MSHKRKNTSFLIFFILVICLVLLITFTEKGREKASFLENTLGQIISPVQKTFFSMSSGIRNFFSGIGERKEMTRNYQELKDKVIDMDKDLIKLEELEKENQRLKSLLTFKVDNEEIIVTSARVIAKNPGNWFNNITIDKGAKHGIEINMAIVTNEGFVGRVIEVADNYSKVRTIVDGKSSISGIIQRNRDNGLIKGNNSIGVEDGKCRMVYLPEDSNVVPGDKILTSGLGEITPKGIYIGQVESVVKDERNLYKTVIIKPGVDFKRIEEVLVVTIEE